MLSHTIKHFPLRKQKEKNKNIGPNNDEQSMNLQDSVEITKK